MATLKYDHIELRGKVKLPEGYRHLEPAEITGIDNMSLLDGINEPIFSILAKDNVRFTFGLKYMLKNYIK